MRFSIYVIVQIMLKKFIPKLCAPNIEAALTLAAVAVLLALLQNLIKGNFPEQYQRYEDFMSNNNLNFVSSFIISAVVIGILGILCTLAWRQVSSLLLFGLMIILAVAVVIMVAVTLYINPQNLLPNLSLPIPTIPVISSLPIWVMIPGLDKIPILNSLLGLNMPNPSNV